MITKYFYRVERITHRPDAEDIITIIKEVRENDLQLARILAIKCYQEELQQLQGKYSPESFNSYDTRKGIGFNYQLLLLDANEEEIYVVESTMEKIMTAGIAQKEEENEIFLSRGMDRSSFKIKDDLQRTFELSYSLPSNGMKTRQIGKV